MPLPEGLVDLIIEGIAEHTPPGVWFSRRGASLSVVRPAHAESSAEPRPLWVPRRWRPVVEVFLLADAVADMAAADETWPARGTETRVSIRDAEVRIRFVADGGTVLTLEPIHWAGPWQVDRATRRASRGERSFGDVPPGTDEEARKRREDARRRQEEIAASPEAVALKQALDEHLDPVVLRHRLRAAGARADLPLRADGRLEDLAVDLASARDRRLPRARAWLLLARGLVRGALWLRRHNGEVTYVGLRDDRDDDGRGSGSPTISRSEPG